MWRLLLIAALGLMHGAGQLQAQCLSSCSCGNRDPFSLSEEPVAGQAHAQLAYRGSFYRPFTDEDLSQLAGAHSVISISSMHAIQLTIGYWLSAQVLLQGTLPFLYSVDNREAYNHATDYLHLVDYGNIGGYGDASVLAGYRFAVTKQQRLVVVMLAGIKMPTGQHQQFGSTGLLAPIALQAGTGSWDPLLQLWADHYGTACRWSARVWTRVSTSALNHHMGNSGGASVSILHDLPLTLSGQSCRLTLTGGLQLQVQQPMKMPDYHLGKNGSPANVLVPFPNSGYRRLLLQTGISLKLPSEISVPLQLYWPVVEKLNGTQTPLRLQIQTGLNFNF